MASKKVFNHERHEKAWRGLIARNPHGLYTDDRSDGSPCARAGSFVEAATLQIFRVFRAFRGQKMGCGRQPTPSLFVWFVVKKFFLDTV
jgi:hypothetical protein